MRPQAGVVPLALEGLQALEVGHARRREIACRHDAVACADLLAAVGLQRPFPRLAVERRRDDAGVELHVAPEVEAIGDVVDVLQDLRLRAVALGPLPLLLQLVGEAVGILQALHVAARTGVAVPEPGPADARAGFVGPDFQAHAAQAMDGIETGQAAADDGDIELALIGGRGSRTTRGVRHLSAFPYCFCYASGEIVVFATVSRLGRLGKPRRRTHCRGRHAPSAVQQAGRTDGRTNVSGLLFLDDKLLAGRPVTSSWISRFLLLSPGRFRHRLLRPPPPIRPASLSRSARPYGRAAAAVCRSLRGLWPSLPSCWPLWSMAGARSICGSPTSTNTTRASPPTSSPSPAAPTAGSSTCRCARACGSRRARSWPRSATVRPG